ncbi:MAG: VWA domain-containing protein [Acidobacteria bacterium]|nr:VWA domain-containing protein [Acidobacteriota bacterium]
MRIALSFLSLAAALAAQEPVPPVLRVTTRLVQINVIVHDRKGQPVADLTKDDFVLLDQGREQKLAYFSVESALAPKPGAAPAPKLPPGTFTNRPELRASAPAAVTAILLDGLNTRFEDQAYARQQIVKFLTTQVQPSDRVALYTLGRTIRVLHDFSSDAASLLRVLARHRGEYAADLDASEPAGSDTGMEELDAWLDEVNQNMSEFYTRNRVHTTLEALDAIAQHMARVPGRKNLIWVSGGFPFSIGLDNLGPTTGERTTFSSDLERTGRTLNNASVAIYPVDARGLVGIPEFSASNRKADLRDGSKALRQIQRTHETMEIMAERTGGKAFYNSNDIKGAVRKAIDDSRVTYVLGYYPAHDRWDGEWREIKLRVRRPRVEVSYRRGYHAIPDRPPGPQDRNNALREAVWSPLEATSIGLTVHLRPVEQPKPGLLRVTIGIDSRNVNLEQREGRWTGKLELLFVQGGGTAEKAGSIQDTLNLNLTPETYREAMRKGIYLAKSIERLAGTAEFRLVVRDATTGAVGSVNVPLKDILPKAAAKETGP